MKQHQVLSSNMDMQSYLSDLAFNNPAQAEEAHRQMTGELRTAMGQFSDYCLTLLNKSDPKESQSLGLILISATYLNDIGTVRCLLNTKDRSFEHYGPIAAVIAAGSGYFEIIQFLFEAHSEWFDSNEFKKIGLNYPFHMAAYNQHREVVEYLLPHTSLAVINAPVLKTLVGQLPPLLIGLVKSECLSMLQLILTRKPDLEIRSSENHTALSEACANCNYEMAEVLIRAGAKVNISLDAPNDRRPGVALNPMTQAFDLLQNSIGVRTTPLDYACANGHVRLAYLLLKSGAKVNAPPSALGSTLMLAARASSLNPHLKHFKRDYPNVVRLLLMHNAIVDQRHPMTDETALISACIEKQVDIAKQLLLAGANPNHETSLGEQASVLLESLGINAVKKTSSNSRTAEAFERAQKKLNTQLKAQENLIRKQLIESLDAGKYNDTVASEVSRQKPQLVLKPESEINTVPTKKKKKKNKKNKNTSQQVSSTLPTPVGTVVVSHGDEAEDKNTDQRVLAELPTKVESIMSAAVATSAPEKLASLRSGNSAEVSADSKKSSEESIRETLSKVDSDVQLAASPVAKKTLSYAVEKLVNQSSTCTDTSKIPVPIFESGIPSGDTLRKFPLRLAGVRLVHYYVTLIPNQLNKLFDSSHTQQLKKMWAAILSERLLPHKSKDTSGVKCLSGNEMLRLKLGFFKDATHKVKHPREDTRVYLQSTLPKDGSRNEIHLELIGPDFHPH